MKIECAEVDEELDEAFGEDSDTARSLYDKLLVHYANMLLTKEDKEKGHADALSAVQQLMGRYADQVS